LPEFLDPVLAYLSENLPPPAYSLLISFLSHGLALASALLTLAHSLLFDSSNWNAQTLLPPLIAFLTAYLAILSLYRTTAWIIRTSFWFIKWGSLLAAIAAGAGWMLADGGNALGGRGAANTIAGVVLDMMNGETGKQSRGSRQRKRPKAWDSFEAHRDWQFNEKQAEKDSKNDAQVLMDNILSATGSAITGSNWWGFLSG
ncbi:hypothetical protein BDP27DRAFT_1144216, partial [Rhodocollybia butyracea]